MSRRAIAIFSLMVPMLCSAAPAEAATKLVALVIGNASEQAGYSAADMRDKLEKLKTQLFRYGADYHGVVEAVDMTRAQLSDRVQDFTGRVQGADVALVVYAGATLHDSDGATYLVPAGWDGKSNDGLYPLKEILAQLRLDAKGKGLLFIDTPRSSNGMSLPAGFEGGIGNLQRADKDDVLITYASMPGGSKPQLIDRVTSHFAPKTVKLPQLAALVQQDVMFDTGGMIVPRISGSVHAELNLEQLEEDALNSKRAQCVAEAAKASAGTAFAAASPAGGVTTVASRVDEGGARGRPVTTPWPYFCPGFGEPSKPASKPKDDGDKKANRHDNNNDNADRDRDQARREREQRARDAQRERDRQQQHEEQAKSKPDRSSDKPAVTQRERGGGGGGGGGGGVDPGSAPPPG